MYPRQGKDVQGPDRIQSRTSPDFKDRTGFIVTRPSTQLKKDVVPECFQSTADQEIHLLTTVIDPQSEFKHNGADDPKRGDDVARAFSFAIKEQGSVLEGGAMLGIVHRLVFGRSSVLVASPGL